MKSIMQEGSTISKAIDHAWARAGKPAEFTVKILEEPVHNMFGLTTKPAKIAFFFDERKLAATTQKQPQRPAAQRHHAPRPAAPKKATPEKKRPAQPAPAKAPPAKAAPARRVKWNDEMVQTATHWLKDAMRIMQVANTEFSSSTSGNNITFRFKSSPMGDQSKDRLLFSGFANLIMATLRNKYKKSFRFYKVILVTE